MNYQFLSPAAVELREGIEYYESQSPGLGLRFLDQVEAAITLIQKYPDAWRQVSENHRMCRVKVFPYGLIYTKKDQLIQISAVMHLHRDPISWREKTS